MFGVTVNSAAPEAKKSATAVFRNLWRKPRKLMPHIAALLVLLGSQAVMAEEPIRWRMGTSWPSSLPLLHASMVDFAESIRSASGGRLIIEVIDPSQHGTPAGLLQAVEDGRFDLASTTAHYYAKQLPAIDFFTTVPFGLTAEENHAWLSEGGGQAIFEQILAPHGILPIAVGNSSVQMGGWFNREITTPDDLKGIRMRISGLPGRVIARLGAVPVEMPISQIIPAFEDGKLDAAEAVVPAIDALLPFEKHAAYQYAPWHEPDAVMHLFISRQKFEKLPHDLQTIFRLAAQASALRSIARGLDLNSPALALQESRGATTRAWPPAVLAALQRSTEEELASITDPDSRRVIDSLLSYKKKVATYSLRTLGAVLPNR